MTFLRKEKRNAELFEYLSRRYGSVEDYFLSAGLTSDEIDAVGRILR